MTEEQETDLMLMLTDLVLVLEGEPVVFPEDYDRVRPESRHAYDRALGRAQVCAETAVKIREILDTVELLPEALL